MDKTVYKVEAEYIIDKVDDDMCRYQDWDVFFSDIFSTKVSAIRKAQKIRSKRNCYVRVTRISITEKGIGNKKLIYSIGCIITNKY